MHYSQLFENKINKLFIDLSYLIKGANNLNTPFSNPWEDNNGKFKDDYEHPGYPTPPLSFTSDINFGLEIKLNKLSYITISLENQISTRNKTQTQIRIKIWSYFNLIK